MEISGSFADDCERDLANISNINTDFMKKAFNA